MTRGYNQWWLLLTTYKINKLRSPHLSLPSVSFELFKVKCINLSLTRVSEVLFLLLIAIPNNLIASLCTKKCINYIHVLTAVHETSICEQFCRRVFASPEWRQSMCKCDTQLVLISSINFLSVRSKPPIKNSWCLARLCSNKYKTERHELLCDILSYFTTWHEGHIYRKLTTRQEMPIEIFYKGVLKRPIDGR